MAKHRELAQIVYANTLGRTSASKIWRTVVVAGAMLGAPLTATAGDPPEEPLGELLQPLVAVLLRLAQDLLHLPLQRRIAEVVPRRRLGSRRVAHVGASQERAGSGQRITGIIAGREWVPLGRGTRVFVDEGSGHEGSIQPVTLSAAKGAISSMAPFAAPRVTGSA